MKHTLNLLITLLLAPLAMLRATEPAAFPYMLPDKEMMTRPHEKLAKLAREQITFPLACFLAGAGPNCYFCYTWGWLGEYGTFDWYPEFDKPLGAPKGDAKRDGWTYRREFEHAAVFVDLEKKTATIDWK